MSKKWFYSTNSKNLNKTRVYHASVRTYRQTDRHTDEGNLGQKMVESQSITAAAVMESEPRRPTNIQVKKVEFLEKGN